MSRLIQELRDFAQRRIELPILSRLFPLPTGLTLLEVGCGGGNGLGALIAAYAPSNVIGVDCDMDAIRAARRKLAPGVAGVSLLVGDACALPLESSSVDVVFDFGTAYHVGEPERLSAEVERVLRPGGLFVYESPGAQWIAHPTATLARTLSGDRPGCGSGGPLRSLWASRRIASSTRQEPASSHATG